MPSPTPYHALIGRLAPDVDPARIEAHLRHIHGALDAIEPVLFAREVKLAADHLRGAAEPGDSARRSRRSA